MEQCKSAGRWRIADFHRGFQRGLFFVVLGIIILAHPTYTNAEERPISVNGVFPNLTVMAKGTGSDTGQACSQYR